MSATATPTLHDNRPAGGRRSVRRPRALIVAGPGTNRDPDLAFALDLAGADTSIALAGELASDPARLDQVDLLAIAGGFSYGDALGAGRMFALELTAGLGPSLTEFVASGRPVIGICNGFQVLTQTGLLPGALGHNASGRFDCRWIELRSEPSSVCVWTRDLTTPLQCPIAHGEGRYVHPDPDALGAAGQVALRYQPNAATGDAGNPNGSVADIAGVTNAAGNVLGLMPHPENFVVARQHPDYSRHDARSSDLTESGLTLFRSGVEHARELSDMDLTWRQRCVRATSNHLSTSTRRSSRRSIPRSTIAATARCGCRGGSTTAAA